MVGMRLQTRKNTPLCSNVISDIKIDSIVREINEKHPIGRQGRDLLSGMAAPRITYVRVTKEQFRYPFIPERGYQCRNQNRQMVLLSSGG